MIDEVVDNFRSGELGKLLIGKNLFWHDRFIILYIIEDA